MNDDTPHPLRLLFSDLDGTCVHYSDSLPFTLSLVDDGSPDIAWNATFEEGESSAVLPLPPSSSGSQGIISTLTLQGYAQLRSRGVKLVLISGCRSSTLFERLACLPAADAYVCESGGRIFYPSTALPTAVGLVEDKTWRLSQKAAGPPGQEGVPVLERVGLLWDEYRRLSAQGLHLDARNYTTAFRVRVKTPEDMKSASGDALPPGLAAAVNLGAVDIYPATSGKKSAAQYLMRRFGGSKDGSDSVCMCDDDNDIEMAMAVRRAYLPGITSESLRRVVEANPDHFYVAARKSVFATEEILALLRSDAAVTAPPPAEGKMPTT